MRQKSGSYGRSIHYGIWYVLGSLAVLAVLAWLLVRLTAPAPARTAALTVYCAAGLRQPLEEVAARYERAFQRRISLDYGSSGELEGKLLIEHTNGVSRCDIYIPADDSFTERTRRRNLTGERIPLAQFHIVLAVKPGFDQTIHSIEDLIASGINYILCDELAGSGRKTRDALVAAGKWELVNQNKKAAFPRVTEAAGAIQSARTIDAGFIWDTTARQFGLEIIELPELQDSRATTSANITANSPRSAAALHFARYLAAPGQGQPYFERHHFDPQPGDPWVDVPELLVFAGGLNRNAIAQTLSDFERREGCRINTQFAGCGTLVGSMKSGPQGMPDAFLTCDASYLEKVRDDFSTPHDVSSTRVVMLVRRGNPHGIHRLEDLARPDLAIGTTDPRMSTLGDLSWQMFDAVGIREALERMKSVVVTTPTAHELIAQMAGHSKLDVALVYEANCRNLGGDFERVDIDHPRATAIQNVAISHQSQFPQLTSRLLETLASRTSRQRFLDHGFQWLAD